MPGGSFHVNALRLCEPPEDYTVNHLDFDQVFWQRIARSLASTSSR
jgi:hypothetical protein